MGAVMGVVMGVVMGAVMVVVMSVDLGKRGWWGMSARGVGGGCRLRRHAPVAGL